MSHVAKDGFRKASPAEHNANTVSQVPCMCETVAGCFSKKSIQHDALRGGLVQRLPLARQALGFGYLRACHSGGQIVAALTSTCKTLRRCKIHPHMSHYKILRYAFAVVIEEPEVELSSGFTALGSHPIPFDSI